MVPVLIEVKVTVTGVFSHTILLTGWSTCPVGLTVIVKVSGGPGHVMGPFEYVGVTVIVAVTGAVPGLVAVKEGRFPVPEAPRPIEILLLVHAYVTVPPDTDVVKMTGAVADPLQTTISDGLFT